MLKNILLVRKYSLFFLILYLLAEYFDLFSSGIVRLIFLAIILACI